MRQDRLFGIYLALVLALSSLTGCSKKEPALPPAEQVPPNGTPTAPPTNPPVTPTAPATVPVAAAPATQAPTVVVENVPAWAKPDLQLQQRILAIRTSYSAAAARGELTKDQLRDIGNAFFEFESRNNAFPAINGLVVPGTPSSGLSWRVALLPYLGEQKLYAEFHQAEPWDSPHNKTLIPRMPKIFGQFPEGKTRLHVLTGPGAPFQMNSMLSNRDLTDGFSDTLAAVVAGPDTAEIWTKPTGLQFDPQQPLKCLGNVGEKFWVVSMAGVVSQLSGTGSPDAFKLLVTHNEGRRAGAAAWNAMGVHGPNERMEAPVKVPIKINKPVTPLPAESPRREWNGVPDDAFVAIVAQPRRILQNPVVRILGSRFVPLIYSAIAPGGPRKTQYDIEQYEQKRQCLGIALQNLDEAIVVIDKSWPADFGKNAQTPLTLGVILKNSAPFDMEAILAVIGNPKAQNQSFDGDFFHGVSISEHEGVALILTGNAAPA